MARSKTISKKCLCLYSCKHTRKCGSTVYLLKKQSIEYPELKIN